MRKVIVSNLITLDGMFAGPNGEIDWHVVNDEFNEFAVDQLDSIDTLLFGRVTYEGMVSYWPSEEAIKNDAVIAEKMNTKSKVVFSKTLDKVGWGKWDNARLVKTNSVDEISKLKQQPGKDMAIFGSGTIVSTLAQAGLIDLYRILVVPIILGKGKPLFADIAMPIKLKLTDSRTLATGVVFLTYEPQR